MTPKELYTHLDKQHPNTWTSGDYYPATLPDGKTVQIRRSNGRGKNAGKRFLHIIKPAKIKVVSPTGEVLNVRDDFLYFRLDPQAGTLTEL